MKYLVENKTLSLGYRRGVYIYIYTHIHTYIHTHLPHTHIDMYIFIYLFIYLFIRETDIFSRDYFLNINLTTKGACNYTVAYKVIYLKRMSSFWREIKRLQLFVSGKYFLMMTIIDSPRCLDL